MTAAERCAKTPLPTIWEIPDELWERIEAILAVRYPSARTGRPRADLRRVLNGIIYRMRSGVQWNQSRSSATTRGVHRWFQAFVGDEVLEEVWAALLAECEALGDLNWTWQAVDGMMGK